MASQKEKPPPEPDHPSDQEDEAEQDAQLPGIPEELSDTELGEEEASGTESIHECCCYPDLGKTLQEEAKKMLNLEK